MMRDRILPTTTALIVWAATTPIAVGQSITPAADGTGTLITTNNGTYLIEGGSFSSDGANLFHSFQDFGLTSGEIANFLSQPQVQNILGRVIGGNPSQIDGLIQVLGGHSNLYLMNPAGLVFGPNASLNVPADFVATTATGIGFGNGQWFEAVGSADYTALVGNPNQFAFDLAQGGAIVNAGDLAVSTGQHLGLVADIVINTGELTASAGQITIAAVPNSSLVNISQSGQLLSLEIEAPRDLQGNVLSINPLTLPALLTGADNAGLSNLGLAADANTVTLTATGTEIPLETQTSLVTGSVDVSGAQGGEIAVLGQNVGLVEAMLDASGATDGGTIRVGGEYHGQGGLPNATYTVVDAASSLYADAGIFGDGGRVIVWADQNTRFGGQVSAEGGLFGGDGGFIEVSGKETLAFTGTASTYAAFGEIGQLLLDPRNITITTGSVGTLPSGLSDHFWDNAENGGDQTIGVADLRSLLSTNDLTLEANKNITWSAGAQLDTTGFAADRTLTLQASDNIVFNEATPILAGGNALNLRLIANQSDSQVLAQDPSTSHLYTNGGALTIQGRNQIHLGQITTNGGAVQVTNSNITQFGNIATAGGLVDIAITGNNALTTGMIDSGVGNIELESRSNLTVGAIATTSGNVNLNSSVGRTATDVGIHAQTITTDTGSVTLSSHNNLNVGTIQTNGGAVNLNNAASREAPFAINTQNITTNGGAVNVNTRSTTELGNINTAGGAVDISLLANRTITTGTIASGAGNIDIEGRNSVTVSAITTTSGSVSLNSAVARSETDVGIHAQTITTDTGSITLSSRNNLNVGRIQTNGGAVNLANPVGRVDPFAITTQDITTNGGAVNLKTLITTTLGNLSTSGGQIDLVSANNKVLTTGTLNSGAGNISVDGRNNLNLGNITTTSGNVTLTSSVNRDASIGINAQNITTQGGQVAIASRNTTNFGHITTQGGAIDLDILRNRVLQGGRLDSSSTAGNGGAIAIDSRGAVLLALINAQGNSNSGTGGAINITTKRDFRVTGSFLAHDGSIASISNVGGIGSPTANIVIDYATRNPSPRFDLAASFNTSGTVGAITNRSQTLQPTQSFSSRDLGTLKILGSVDPILDPDEPVIPPFSPSPFFGEIATSPSGDVTPDPLPEPLESLEELEGLNVVDLAQTTSSSSDSSSSDAASFSGSGGGGSFGSAAAAFAHAEQSFGSAFNAYFASGSGDAGASAGASGSAAASGAGGDVAAGGVGAAGSAGAAGSTGSSSGSASGSGGTGGAAGAASVGFNAGNSSAVSGSGTAGSAASGGSASATSGGSTGSVASNGSAGTAGSSGAAGSGSAGGASSSAGASGGSSASASSDSGGASSSTGASGSASGTSGGSGSGSSSLSGGSSATHAAGNSASSGSGGASNSAGTSGSASGMSGDNGSAGSNSSGSSGSSDNGSSASGGGSAAAGETATGGDSGGSASGEGSSSSDSADSASSSDAAATNNSSSDSDSSASGSGGEGSGGGSVVSVADAQASLRDIEAITGVSPALLYGIFAPPLGMSTEPQPTDQLFLILVPPNGDPIMQAVPANRQMVMRQARSFRRRVTSSQRQDYLPPAQKLYQWLIEPMLADIEAAGIEHLTFLLDSGLRSLPIAALHSGEEFLVEQYSLSLMPSMGLSDLSYRPITHMDLLAMGTSTFDEHEPLPAAGVEVELLTQELWEGESLQDDNFSAKQLKESRSQTPYGMLHLATHSNFQAGTPQDSYIQMGNERLGLNELRQLGLHSPAIELMVLSACQTALGDTEAELGFAGLAVLAGVKTAMGSLWQIDDLGTLGFMSSFYSQLREAPIKASALQRAQLSFLHAQVQVETDGLRVGDRTIPLPSELQFRDEIDLTHPYYWSAFTMIGTPW
ncbi:MAG: CHAT domain-containing protein [Spirulina sp. SIO3F2]|nr:CHAT domain-containing protein [Spirulina sp. SIO3F2]